MATALAAPIDHLVWGSPDLESAVELLYARSGVRAAFGGSHPELGTRNAIARLGEHVFLEVLAPDPALAPGGVVRRLAKLDEPTLLMWAARTRDAAATAARAKDAGYTVTMFEGRRTRPDGELVRWTNVFVSGHGAGTLVPFFIEWNGPGHPAVEAPTGLTLKSFSIETPDPASLRKVLAALDVEAPVRKGPRDLLRATIDTSRGPLVLDGPD